MPEEKTIAVVENLSAAEDAVMLLDRKGYVMAQVSVLAVDAKAGQEGEHLVVVEGDEGEMDRARRLLEDSASQVTHAESIEDVLEKGKD